MPTYSYTDLEEAFSLTGMEESDAPKIGALEHAQTLRDEPRHSHKAATAAHALLDRANEMWGNEPGSAIAMIKYVIWNCDFDTDHGGRAAHIALQFIKNNKSRAAAVEDGLDMTMRFGRRHPAYETNLIEIARIVPDVAASYDWKLNTLKAIAAENRTGPVSWAVRKAGHGIGHDASAAITTFLAENPKKALVALLHKSYAHRLDGLDPL